MSHKNKKSLKTQINNRLRNQTQYGRKKYIDKEKAKTEWKKTHNPKDKGKGEYIQSQIRPHIYSKSTYENYKKHLNYFAEYCEGKGCITLRQCRKYVDEWLQTRIDRGLSAYTIKLEAAALGKLYQEPTTNFLKTPERNRSEITRSRTKSPTATKFEAVEAHKELIEFCQATGLRRKELETLKPEQLEITENGPILHIKGKGGRTRQAPIIGENQAAVIEKIQATPEGQKVWGKVNKSAPIHSYRADYRSALYKSKARPISQIKTQNKANKTKLTTDIYYCRKDNKTIAYDKKAMRIVTQALGHSRLQVVAGNYLYKV